MSRRNSASPQTWPSTNKEETDFKKMSKEKTPPNNLIPTSFHHLLPGGPLFATISSHSNNQPTTAFNPGFFL